MHAQYMILSTPNCGTDWLCKILASHGRGLSYYNKEFFNPICNERYGEVLASAFGCELASCYRKIAQKVSADELDRVYDATWLQQTCNFDKENFAAWRVEFFAERFDLAFLQRPVVGVFPPSRLRVWAWYDAIWQSAVQACRLHGFPFSLRDRARQAYWAAWCELSSWAERLNAPVIQYDVLCRGDRQAVLGQINRGWIAATVDVGAAVDEIIATRRWTDKTHTPPA